MLTAKLALIFRRKLTDSALSFRNASNGRHMQSFLAARQSWLGWLATYLWLPKFLLNGVHNLFRVTLKNTNSHT